MSCTKVDARFSDISFSCWVVGSGLFVILPCCIQGIHMLHICACMCHTANFTERLQRGKRHSYVSRKKRRLHGNVSGSLGKSAWTWGGTISLSESHHEPQMQSPKDGDCSFPCVSALAPRRWPRSHARGPIDKNGSPTLINLSPGRQSKRGSKRTKNRERQKQ